MIRKMKQLNDILTTQSGIFSAIQSLNVLTWLSSDDAKALDIEYYINHSGEKFVSPLTDALYDKDNTTYLTNLAKIILLKFANNWNRIYQAYVTETYNPLENYSMIEDESVNTEMVVETDGENNVFGFNTSSTDALPSSNSGIKQTTSGTDEKNNRHHTRSGNIGVTTSQQMLQSELDLRKYDLYEVIMSDIDSVMCLAYRGV